jgi:hypothetical protein
VEQDEVGASAFSIMTSDGKRKQNSTTGAISHVELSESEGTDNFCEEVGWRGGDRGGGAHHVMRHKGRGGAESGEATERWKNASELEGGAP